MIQAIKRRWKGPAMTCSEAYSRYLPVSEELSKAALYLTGAGHAIVRPGEDYPPSGRPALYQFDWLRGRTLPEFQAVLISAGAGEFESAATGHVQVNASSLFFVMPGVWHRFRPLPDTGWTERWISFNGDLAHRLFRFDGLAQEIAVVSPRDPAPLVSEFDQLLAAVRSNACRHPTFLALIALRVLSLCISARLESRLDPEVGRPTDSSTLVLDPLVHKAIDIIWTDGQLPMSVSDIARQLPVTRRTLDRRFMEATGHSVLEEINKCRLSRARRLLLETNLPIKTVTHLAGFSSAERMRVLFLEREGLSPTAYRQRFAEAEPGGRRHGDLPSAPSANVS